MPLLTLTRFPAQGSACKELGRNGQRRPSRPRPLTLRSLTAPARAHDTKTPVAYWQRAFL
ncbi:hypothetical protein HMPREF0541_02979 [Lacticaseibacillus rhamnosus ATCC 21052]|nr:hypothetical protein HMPREF0541_02979 [Lacticaseibacillus rhamnosus ATCC 21052]